jgi:multisubunit Na+/H+ antiporter MnhE subunit
MTDKDSRRRAGAGGSGGTGGRARAGVWLLWWAVLMAGWLIVDDSLAADELLAGAASAALGATLAELAGQLAATRLRVRVRWLVPALRLPASVVRDTAIVFVALWRRLARGQQPDGGFREVPVRFGPMSVEGRSRRALLIAGVSFAPNTFAVDLDAERDVLVVHDLVRRRPGARQ